MPLEFEELQGDLFSSPDPTDALAHCVSEDLHMGKGIAVPFKELFGQVDHLRSQRCGPGQVAYLTVPDTDPPRRIFYMITKRRYYDKPTRVDFTSSLRDLRRLCEELGVTTLAIPRIGSGLDRLPKAWVDRQIRDVFEGWDGRIRMYYLE
ncbi:hypothetical protein BC938DRAFT_479088 [Jimgerdemannia flammicorona]|uniref:ADP-ribose 1''-phosphate phosphatase n=1 Tax=Jimgerdemannia flammicorona TaxID=994334 RepID=A0A433QLN8_9FUNG|nr:hypothetical protein BC938DRAFT_479088 [Jimgerdemannia flammicorona]